VSYKYISLFSGAGGLDLGLERAGLSAISLCEIEKSFCDTLEVNAGWKHIDGRTYFENALIHNGDIKELSTTDLMANQKTIDLVVGGPPCQAFSSSGKQLSVLDSRGELVHEFVQKVAEIKPKVFLFENVRGLVTARNAEGIPGGVIKDIICQLEEIGYSVRATLLNAADYGGFQRRVRCFLIGSSAGLAPEIPEPSHSKKVNLLNAKWRSLKEFLEIHADQNNENFNFPTDKLMAQLKDIPNGSGVKSPGKPEPTRPNGHWGYRQGTFIANLDLPARTVTGSASQDWVRWNGNLRRLTFNEVKLLQGFPKDWNFHGTKAQHYKQVGNAVPAIFGELLGKVIVNHLNSFPNELPVKLDFPKVFKGYIDYTIKDHARNASARSIHSKFSSTS
jgi:DNA (cytosine-5)-methyltransferase 1